MGSVGFFLTLLNFVNIVAVLWHLKFMLAFTIKNSSLLKCIFFSQFITTTYHNTL